MKISTKKFSIPTAFLLTIAFLASSVNAESRPSGGTNPDPVVLGHGVGLFDLGTLIAEDDFNDLENWVVQVEDRADSPPAKVEAKNHTLNCLVPGRGCTVWFKEKLKTRVTISYDVVCPSTAHASKEMLPRDINNFWMASDPGDPAQGLFDSQKYTGGFGSYNKMLGYYASTGGGRNTTTRMRRYPREVNGKPTGHLALTARDGDPDFLITPDSVMHIQLVAYDDVIQYIVDGKLVYEAADGDRIQVEGRDPQNKRVMQDASYDLKRFPFYKEGYFGFRMVGTHHIYSNFRVHTLVPARNKVTISSIKDLREVMTKSNQHVVMKPGVYALTDLVDGRTGFHFSGSNNYLDLSGVTIRTPISTLSKSSTKKRRRWGRGRGGVGTCLITGDHVTVTGGTFENTYPNEMEVITDFGSYNQNPNNYPSRGVTEMRLVGDDLRLIDCQFTVRGSFPYGYGNMYGIGGDSVIPLKKHCGILITGKRTIIDRCKVKMEAFGHAIYVQGGDQITVRHTEVEGEVRPSNDLYTETNRGDLAKKFNYQLQWPDLVNGLPIPKDHMINLMEDGIRAYAGTGHMIVENCKVTKARGGIKLYMAKSATVSDCEVRDCVIQGFSLPSRGTLTRCRGNAAYGPLLYVHMDSHSSQKIDLEVLPAPHSLGDHPLAAIKGDGHQIRFRSKEPGMPKSLRPIIIGYPLRFDYLCVDFPKVPKGHEEHFKKFAPTSYRASDISFHNETGHPVVLGAHSRDNKISSFGLMRDFGASNSFTPLASKKESVGSK